MLVIIILLGALMPGVEQTEILYALCPARTAHRPKKAIGKRAI